LGLIALKVNFFGFIAFADVFLVLREPAACSSFAGRFGWIFFFSAILDAPSLSRGPSWTAFHAGIMHAAGPERR
jgi:hypothetical protein